MSMDSMKKYRLAVDENGSPFVLNSKGSIDFGYITSAHEFIEYVSMNFESIRQGIGDTFLLEVQNEHNDTLFIKLVNDLGYWKVISGGVFNLRYSKKKKEIYSGSDNRAPQPAPDSEGLSLSKM